MSEELAYVMINPYTILKSRTGGVIARLLSRSAADLVTTRMFAPSKELIDEYVAALDEAETDEHPDIKALIREYLLENYAPDRKTGQRKRVMFLLFKGEDAVRRLHDEVVGHITSETVSGESIRDTYGDCVKGSDGNVRYFEPAVMICTNPKNVERELKIWAKHSEKDSGILKNAIKYKDGIKAETTLVLIKPDCFQWPSPRPGTIIDTFSKTGLYIVGTKVVRMSINQALEFYGPVKEVLLKKFNGDAAVTEEQFGKIIRFMTGLDQTWVVSDAQRSQPGQVKCLALIYQGENAVSKIRSVLGATDPSKAAPSTVRREFGKDVMVNTAHASDSTENAVRETGILKIEDNDLRKTVEGFYK